MATMADHTAYIHTQAHTYFSQDKKILQLPSEPKECMHARLHYMTVVHVDTVHIAFQSPFQDLQHL